MSDQQADIDRIAECARELGKIHRTFTKGADPAAGLGVSVLGSEKVIDALSSFGSNWKIHREKLAEEVNALAGITSAAAEAYETIDSELAKALREVDARHGGKRGRK
ncbi:MULTISPECIES: hypothetical protein [Streptomyces]|uniref:hypothetical protein n=1 Tax=Streptomyces TaxID=1883 RepID=UPI001884940C|nr:MULTISPECIES: hypothetical protein [Streptomyces]MBZ6131464.1 hypothetical protein [Streptomyces olivaceus]MCC2264799.1 hypothetical protein [Streptomyces sp. CT1-17]MCM8549268.1 hypothetical protein [Streptomyces sp. STCH 565 A]MCU8589961.1 hypothetical protein [Streptomyces sp. A13(2022)]GHI92024.1 hypothetical protein TPA0905_14950 [Streptomyces olivaceus]